MHTCSWLLPCILSRVLYSTPFKAQYWLRCIQNSYSNFEVRVTILYTSCRCLYSSDVLFHSADVPLLTNALIFKLQWADFEALPVEVEAPCVWRVGCSASFLFFSLHSNSSKINLCAALKCVFKLVGVFTGQLPATLTAWQIISCLSCVSCL